VKKPGKYSQLLLAFRTADREVPVVDGIKAIRNR
jgi:hypothetical protein